MSTTGKTPVSILQETLLRQKVVPLYELLQSGVGMHQGIFTYRVTAGPVLAIGSGRSKKEAKHEAAKLALGQIKNSTPEPLDDEVLLSDVTSPYEASLKDNAVGTLGDICATHELPIPEYNLLREDGPPHAKTFIFSCKVSTMEESAQGRTKKQAKQLAALKMLNHFSELKLFDVPKPKEEQHIAEQDEPVNQPVSEPQKVAIGVKIDELSNALRDQWTDDELTELRELKLPCENPVAILKETCKQLGLECVFDNQLVTNGGADGLLLHLSTKPTAVFFSFFPNAEETCATEAIQYLKVMTHSSPIPVMEIFGSLC